MTYNEFGTVPAAAVTVLVDNRADFLVKSSETVKRFTDAPLLAEHGFAALVDLGHAGPRILWDAGMTTIALLENMRRMKIDPQSIDKIALSHGHGDHTASMTEVLKAIAGRPYRRWDADATWDEIDRWVQQQRTPLVAHPAAFRERWSVREDGKKAGPFPPPPRAEWEAAGAEIVLADGPYQLAAGCWTTGAVPRKTFETAGTGKGRAYRQGNELLTDIMEDDQTLVINVQDKGLVILAGCAHAGILNTIQYAQEISGQERVYAVLGGFHLAPADDGDIQRTVDAMHALAPQMIVPTHCTGFKAISAFARQMPEQFVEGVVGTTYKF